MLCVTDLERENAELKIQLQEQDDERLLVQITGPNRTPIYYEGSLKDGSSGRGRTDWCLSDGDGKGNTNNNVILLPLSKVIDSEIWLSGILIETFQDVKRFFGCRSHTSRRIYIYPGTGVTGRGMSEPVTDSIFFGRGKSPVPCVVASIVGGMSDMEFSNFTNEQQYNFEQQIALHDDLHLKIRSIFFRQKNIIGALSLLEKLGIHTSVDGR